MALHYTTIAKMFKGCPTIVAVGPADTVKSTAIAAALSIAGIKFTADEEQDSFDDLDELLERGD